MRKVYVSVICEYDIDGRITPREILWPDGWKFEIDKILNIRKAASLSAGGCGIRYTVRIEGRERHLFLEEGRWFVEGK
jgi:hypothetical protein